MSPIFVSMFYKRQQLNNNNFIAHCLQEEFSSGSKLYINHFLQSEHLSVLYIMNINTDNTALVIDQDKAITPKTRCKEHIVNIVSGDIL